MILCQETKSLKMDGSSYIGDDRLVLIAPLPRSPSPRKIQIKELNQLWDHNYSHKFLPVFDFCAVIYLCTLIFIHLNQL